MQEAAELDYSMEVPGAMNSEAVPDAVNTEQLKFQTH